MFENGEGGRRIMLSRKIMVPILLISFSSLTSRGK